MDSWPGPTTTEQFMTVLNVGGTGFIGSALTDALLAAGESVVCYDRRPGSVAEDATVIEGDVTDYEALSSAFEAHEPDAVAHLAYVLTAETETNPHRATRVNAVGTDNVLRAAVEHGVDRIVYASSIAAMGSHDEYPEPVTESMAVPAALSQYPRMSLYGAAKQFNEFQAREYERRAGLETVGVRPTVVFGPGRERGRSTWASNFVTDPATGGEGHIACRPEQRLNMVYRDDVARLFDLALRADAVDHSVYLSGGHTVTARDLADRVESIVGGTVTCDPSAPEVELPAAVSHERAQGAFGYDLTPLDESIRYHAEAVS
jgi:nucleoside-diphosphate-sugar epimerase